MIRFLLYVVLLAIAPVSLAGQAPRATIAVLGAMPEEVDLWLARLQSKVTRQIEGLVFVQGTFSGRSVVVARVGVGKVNAATTVTLLLEHYRPDQVIFTGVAGALDSTLVPGDIVLASYTAQHDLGAVTADGMTNFGVLPAGDTIRNPVRFPGDTLLLRLARAAAAQDTPGGAPGQIREGAVLTGDVFVANDSVRRDLLLRFPDALAVEMEGGAVAQVCWQMGRVPLLVVRSISDGAGTIAAETYAEFLRRAANRSSDFVARIVSALPANDL